MSRFWVNSLYGAHTKQGLVHLHHADWSFQCSPSEARAIAGQILEAAEAAEQDAFLVEWVRAEIGVGDQEAAGLLQDFRHWKDAKRERAKPFPSPPAGTLAKCLICGDAKPWGIWHESTGVAVCVECCVARLGPQGQEGQP